jgi:hypothetical protein
VRDQLTLIRAAQYRAGFAGELTVTETADPVLELTWRHGADSATLRADLASAGFEVLTRAADGTEQRLAFG